MPQNPTQNIFMGLPVELLEEEAHLLVAKKAAYICEDAVAHLTQLTAMDASTRKQYLQSIITQRKNAQKSLDEDKAARSAEAKAKRSGGKARPAASSSEESRAKPMTEKDGGVGLFDTEGGNTEPLQRGTSGAQKTVQTPGITPTTSKDLIDTALVVVNPDDPPKACPLYALLNSRGYFITPGLRFGGHYSVYPGDPFRYHAHHLATSYDWDEEITILDLITSGRLGTGVKKSFLMGGKQPGTSEEDSNTDGHGVRAFCIEWAGM
jgi:tRNA-splicing endonuclease subunit Sen34